MLYLEALEQRVLLSTVTLSPLKDNTLYENATGSLSNGGGSHFYVGKTAAGFIRRGLLSFDMAGSVPVNATITSVELTLHMSRTAISTGQTVDLHRLTTDWGEGVSVASNGGVQNNEGRGTTAQANDATWIHTFSPAQSWTTAGGDFDLSVSASQNVADINFYTWVSTNPLVADVQGWLDNPASNFGWILLGNESSALTAKQFDTRENLNLANRPMLTIDFTVPPLMDTPPTVALVNTTTTLPENTNTSSRIQVADIQITDDGFGSNALSLSGADQALFEIGGSVLYLKAGVALDFETKSLLDVTVAVDDASVGSTPDDTALLSIEITNVNESPTVANPIEDQGTTQDIAFNFSLSATTFNDPDTADTLMLSATLADDSPLPVWLNFAGMTFSGTPSNDDVGTLSIKVTAADGNGGQVSDAFDLTIANTNTPPILAHPLADQESNEGVAFNFTVPGNTFDDVDGDSLVFSAIQADGSPLPAWLGFAGNTFSGIPTHADAGLVMVKVTADDGNGGQVSDAFDLTVIASPTVQVILDLDRTTVRPSQKEYLNEEKGESVKISLKGHPDTVATLILTSPDELGRQRLVSVDLASPEPSKTILAVKTIGHFTVETITGDGAKMLDLKNGSVIGHAINMTGAVSKIVVGSLSDGSHIQLGGTPEDRLSLTITGAAGTFEATEGEGVNLVFPGLVTKLVAHGWYGGLWDVGSVGKVQIIGGDFSPTVDIAGGFKDFQITGGNFMSSDFRSGTTDGNGDGDPMNDGDGSGGKIRVKPDKEGNGGVLVNANVMMIDGALKSLEGLSVDANLTASDEVKLLRAKTMSGPGGLNGTFTAKRFGKIESQGGDAQFNLFTTGLADELGNKAAVDSINITGANWNGGRIETQMGTMIKAIQVREKQGQGGLVTGTVDLVTDLVQKLQTGHIFNDFTQSGDVKNVTLGRIIGSTFRIGGDVVGKLNTASQGDGGFVNSILDLLNPADRDNGIPTDQAVGSLRIDHLTDPGKIRTK